jgi:succinyl-CoA synthetase beta subunit
VAKGIISALEKIEVKLPGVIRLAGTNAKEASELLAKSKMNFTVADSLQDAAEKVVNLLN